MKKMLNGGILSLCMLLAAGCTSEELVKSEGQQAGEDNFTLEVELGEGSRAYYEEVNGSYPIKWNETDKIEVRSEDGKVHGKLSFEKFTDDSRQKATFRGTVYGNKQKLAYAVYPVPEGGKIDLTTRDASMPNPPMIGSFKGDDKSRVDFEETTPAIQLTINNIPAGETLLLEGEGISGTAKVKKLGDENFGLEYTSDNSDRIVVTNLPEGDQTIYIPVIAPAGTLNENGINEITLTVGLKECGADITKAVKFKDNLVTNVRNGNGFLYLTYIPATETTEAQLIEAWDGEADTSWYDESGTEFTLSKASELAGLEKLVNEGSENFDGKTIKLGKSVNLDGKAWTPIGKRGVLSFRGTFDGQGNTISNFIVAGGDAGLFGQVWGATIKNLNIEGATIDGTIAGAVIGYVHGSAATMDKPTVIEDVTVTVTTVNGQDNEPLFGAISYEAVLKIVKNGEETTVSAAQIISEKLAEEGLVVLDRDIDLIEPIVIPTGVTAELDLNGKTLSGSILAPNATLTVENGTLSNSDPEVSAIEINAGELNLDNVTIESARHAVRIDGEVKATINGGEYRLTSTSGTTQHAVNVSGNADVTINGGTFIGPKGTSADSGAAVNVQAGSTVTINGGDFSKGKNSTLASKGTLTVSGGTFDQDPTKYLAEGYKVTKIEENKWIVTEDEVTPAVKAEDIKEAIAAGSSSVTLVEDMELNSEILGGAQDLTINLEAGTTVTVASGALSGDKDFTFTGDKSTTVKFVNENPGYEGPLAYHDNAKLTFKGVTFNANNISGICARDGEVIFEDCVITGELEKTIASKFEFTRCKFDVGVTQVGYGCSEIVFDGCTFETDGYGIKIYDETKNSSVNLIVKGCSFKKTGSEAKSAIFLDHIIDDITYNITVETCTFEGYTVAPTPEENIWAERMIVADSFVQTADGQYIFSYQTGAEGGDYHKILTDTELVVTVK